MSNTDPQKTLSKAVDIAWRVAHDAKNAESWDSRWLEMLGYLDGVASAMIYFAEPEEWKAVRGDVRFLRQIALKHFVHTPTEF
jgi:hypothetical protein